MTKNRYWTLAIILLVAIIAIGSLVVWLRYSGSRLIEISIPPSQELSGEIYIGGAVTNPGFYPLKDGDSLQDITEVAGGTTGLADRSSIRIYIPGAGEGLEPQKVDLNRAETWLLEALPGIGEVRAQAIIDYRQQNGRFHNTNELTKVEGIGITTYEQIKYLITVAD